MKWVHGKIEEVVVHHENKKDPYFLVRILEENLVRIIIVKINS